MVLSCHCERDATSSETTEPYCEFCGRPILAMPQTWWSSWRDQSTGLLISTGLHAVVLVILACWILPAITVPEEIEVTLAMDPGDTDQSFEVDASELSSLISEQTLTKTSRLPNTAAMTASSNSTALPAMSRVTTGGVEVRTPASAKLPSFQSPNDLMQTIRPLRRSDPRSGGVVQQSSVTGALQGVLGHLRGESQSDMVQVVWLLDASISLHRDRQEIAEQLVPFYKEMIARPNRKEKPFRSVVMGYGAKPVVLQNSTDNPARVVQAIAGMSSDPSGLENVFTAVQFALKSFGKWKGTTVIVIWTDESGDDLALLEDTIRLCREHRTLVHVVGPEAVLGMELGLQNYVVPETNQAFLLPVKRGPDAALPERLRLPYWFDSLSPPWTQNGAYIGGGTFSYGGPLREGLLSGVGPYALTRMALETGGTFTILQRSGDAPPMSWETQRLYLPDYQEAREIASEVQRSPIRRAVVEAAAITWQADLHPPMRSFFGRPMNSYPYGHLITYMPAEVFQVNLKAELARLMRQSEQDQAVIEAALACMDPITLESAFENEKSDRWRAWYDLNLGRLLAMSVRIAEYHETLRLIREGVGLDRETNYMTLVESGQLKTGRVAEQRAELAKEHLQAVLTEHAGTPWARLAQWELENALGFVARPAVIPLPKPMIGKPSPQGPAPSLPNL
ncbi:hypothetical protein GC163_24080 [bacterium]|nr:hypothetical protein [bacterium]